MSAPTRPRPGLDAALARIDGLRLFEPYRLVLRACACHNYGDAEAWHREMRAALTEAVRQSGVPTDEARRAVLAPAEYLTAYGPSGGAN